MKSKHIISLLIIVSFGTLLLSCQSDLKFNSEIWKNNGGENITLDTRTKMVNDLIDSEILLSKNEIEIEGLIGKPEKLYNKNENLKDYYPVQEKYGWKIDPKEMTFLEISYNEQGMSNTVKLITTK